MHAVAFILTMVGGVNWLLVGLFKKDLLAMIGLGGSTSLGGSTIAMIVYILVGLSALYLIFSHKQSCKMCDKGAMGGAPKMGM